MDKWFRKNTTHLTLFYAIYISLQSNAQEAREEMLTAKGLEGPVPEDAADSIMSQAIQGEKYRERLSEAQRCRLRSR